MLEGRSAFIRVGESRPVASRQVVRSVVNGQVVDRVIESTDYRDATTGFNVLPRVQGVAYEIDHYTVTPELSPFPTKGEAIMCEGPETLKISRMSMECTKYSFRDMQAWVRNVDDTLVRFLVPGRREIVINEKPHQFAKVIEEAAEDE